MEIKNHYFDLESKEFKTENNYAGDFIDFIYGTPRGKFLNYTLYSRKYFNYLFGLYKNSPFSLSQAYKDKDHFNVPMNEFIQTEWKSYTDFFLRKFKEGARPFPSDPHAFPAFGEGSYFIFDKITPDIKMPVKSDFLNIENILGNKKVAQDFPEASVIICRLCPVDYHHFHYPDAGKTLQSYDVKGGYHSVNPLALLRKGDIFCKNYRRVSILETTNFGKLAYVEVGALVVGKIIQTHKSHLFQRGDLKGHFAYGASTLIVITQKNKIRWNQDILENTKKGIECKVKLGRSLGEKATLSQE